MTETRAPTRLMIVFEVGTGAPERLAAALAAAEMASVVFRGAEGKALEARTAAPLVAAAQKAGAAALIESDAGLARTLRADGVHLAVTETAEGSYEEARETLGGRALIGLDAGRSRHDAMTVGEAGADYIGFGIPAFVKERETAIERRLELISWWAEIFEVPCVAFDVASPEEARALAEAGADFIAITVATGRSAAEVQDTIRAVVAAMAPSRAEP